ncbi:hypothetical protein GCM10009841_22200 [Microlunatus panaciterrae]
MARSGNALGIRHGAERLSGQHGAERLSGQHGAERLSGQHGAERLSGQHGAERLTGQHGAERLSAQAWKRARRIAAALVKMRMPSTTTTPVDSCEPTPIWSPT